MVASPPTANAQARLAAAVQAPRGGGCGGRRAHARAAWRPGLAALLIGTLPLPTLLPVAGLTQQAWSTMAPRLAEFELRLRQATQQAAAAVQRSPAAPAPVAARRPDAAAEPRVTFHGPTSYYGAELAGQPTANGETFNPLALTMAHPSLPFGTLVRVTNPANQHSVVVRVNDRGPFIPGRVADLSSAAAERLRMLRAGVARLRFEVLGNAPPAPPSRRD